MYQKYLLSCQIAEDLPEDDHIALIRGEWFSQDFVDPLLFVTSGTEHQSF